MDPARVLGESPTFQFLSPDGLSRIASFTALEAWPAETVLFRQGDPGEVLYVIVSGRVAVLYSDADGPETVVAELGPGDTIGEMAIFTGAPRSASVRTEADTELLSLKKSDFDRILDENPRLARSFLEAFCHRLSKTNVRLGEETSREQALHELLRDDVREEAVILGTTRHALQLRSQADKAAASNQPVLVYGEPGTEELVIAQTIHDKSQRAGKPFLCLDCAKIPAVGLGEAGNGGASFMVEVTQLSALFGHERGVFSFARSNRLGYVELAHGGTLVLQNAERLLPAVQEKLAEYLRSGRFQRLGNTAERASDVRVIATTHTHPRQITDGKFIAGLDSLFADLSFAVPPLRERKKDLTAWVDHFIKVYSLGTGKQVQGISKEAMNLILAYDWPDNLEELQSVVQRGVRLADGPVLTAEQIFIGLTPFEPGTKLNLLRIPVLKRALESRLFPGLLQSVSVAGLVYMVASGLLGPSDAQSNGSIPLAWGLWWPLLIFGIFLTGRFFCGVCPMSAIAWFLQRRWTPTRKVPAWLKQYGLYGAAAGFVVIIWTEQITHMVSSPFATSILLLTILTGAVVTSLTFERAAWCRFMCPLGRMIGTYATLSIIELRTNGTVCTAECKTHGCYTGTERAPGCPMFEGAFALHSNETCKMCGNCIKSCVNDAVRLNLRAPGTDAWSTPQHSLPLAAFVPVLASTVLGTQLRATDLYRTWTASISYEPLVYLGVMVLIAALLAGLFIISAAGLKVSGEPLQKRMAWVPYAFLPMAMAGEMAQQIAAFFSQAGQLVPALARQIGLGDSEFLAFSGKDSTIQVVLLGLGLVGSLYLGRRLLDRYRPSATSTMRAPVYLVALLLALMYGVLLIAI